MRDCSSIMRDRLIVNAVLTEEEDNRKREAKDSFFASMSNCPSEWSSNAIWDAWGERIIAAS